MSPSCKDFGQAMAAAGFSGHVDSFRPGWEESQAARPAGEVPFLQAGFLRWSSDQAGLSASLADAILAAAACIRANPGLSALAWYCHERLFRACDSGVAVSGWPVPASAMGPHAGLFYAIVILSGTPQRQEIYRRLGIPAEIVRDSVSDLEICIRTEPVRELDGRFGISGAILGWLLLTWRGQLYRLGRLQFLPDRFHGRLRAFRHVRTGAVIALAEGGCRFRPDGQFDGAGGITDLEGAWTATLAESAKQLLGFPISPRGQALSHRVRLRKAEWTQVLAPNAPVLGIHMAAGAPLTPEACGASVRSALEFFPTYFPATPFVGFDCVSWLLDPQLPALLPATSNLVRFQQGVYVFPYPGGTGELPWQLQARPDPLTGQVPPPTGLQRACQAHAERGGRFLIGGCFLLREDAARWGGSSYLSQRLPWRWLTHEAAPAPRENRSGNPAKSSRTKVSPRVGT
jgi:hypothetical protein